MVDLGTIVLPLLILNLILVVVALVDLFRRDASRVRGEVKWPWILVILLITTFGPIIYLVAGRKN